MGVLLRPPHRGEAPRLTALCLRSKAVHGYDATFMAACRDELTLTEDKMAAGPLCVASHGTVLVGLAQIIPSGATWCLETLFVEPDHMGKGIGRRLLNWAMKTAREWGANALIIEADPGAEAFYRKFEAKQIGEALSGSIPGRYLPKLFLPV